MISKNTHKFAFYISILIVSTASMTSFASTDTWYQTNADYKLCEQQVYRLPNGVGNQLLYSSCSDYQQKVSLTVSITNKLDYPIQFNCQALTSSMAVNMNHPITAPYAIPPSCSYDSKISPTGLINPGVTASLTLNSGSLVPFMNEFGINKKHHGFIKSTTANLNNSSQVLISVAAGEDTWRVPFTFNEYALSNEDGCIAAQNCSSHQTYHTSVFQTLNYAISTSQLINTNWWGTDCSNSSCFFTQASLAQSTGKYISHISDGNPDNIVLKWNASDLIDHANFKGIVFYTNGAHPNPSNYGTIALTIEKGAQS